MAAPSANPAFGSQRRFKWRVGASGSFAAGVSSVNTSLTGRPSSKASMGLLKPRTLDISETNIAMLGSDLEKKTRFDAAHKEAAWAEAGKAVGWQIWRIEQFKVVAWPKEEYGKFYSGDSYICLFTYQKDPKSPKLSYDIHFWLGKNTTQDEAGTAAYKTVELDDFLGTAPVQHREVDGYESDLFLSRFTTFHTLEGGIATGFKHVEPEKYEPRLLRVKGKLPCVVRQVDMLRSSLNSGDVFILDAGTTVYQFNGKASSAVEKGEATRLCRAIEDERNGRTKTVVIEEGRMDKDILPFWQLLGGEGKIAPAEEVGPDDKEVSNKVLLRLSDATGSMSFAKVAEGKAVKRVLLCSADVFVFDTGFHVFVWIGAASSAGERSKGLVYAAQYLKDSGRPPFLPITRILQGGENEVFEEAFA